MSTFSFASIISALKNTGASSSTIASAVQGLGLGNSWSSQAKADLTAIAAASADPTEVARLANELKEIPGLPASVASAAAGFSPAAGQPPLTQIQITELIPAVESAITAAAPSMF